jgi:AcrR family transcriptional regulator
LISKAKKAVGVELAPRATPTQKRAKELVENILDTAAGLLDEVGVDALTTNLIAERAGIRIASLYRYFPNKFAVIAALWERVLTRELATLTEFMSTAGGRMPLDTVVTELVDAAMAVQRNSPGILTLLRAMRVTPELREVEAASSELVASHLAVWLEERGGKMSADRLPLVARMAAELAWPALDYASGLGAEGEAKVIEELKLATRSYFANYFDD